MKDHKMNQLESLITYSTIGALTGFGMGCLIGYVDASNNSYDGIALKVNNITAAVCGGLQPMARNGRFLDYLGGITCAHTAYRLGYYSGRAINEMIR